MQPVASVWSGIPQDRTLSISHGAICPSNTFATR
jgi:hypothetical protein